MNLRPHPPADRRDSAPLSPRAVVRGIAEDLREGRADLVEPGSFRVAVVTAAGRAIWTETGFLDLIGDPAESDDCVRLAGKARWEGRLRGLVRSRTGDVVAMEAVTGGGGWPLPSPARIALETAAERILLVAFAPSRSSGIALVSAKALGLTPREADLAAALLESPSVHLAAAKIGMSPATAKDTLARACRRAGVRGASNLVDRLLKLACTKSELRPEAIAEALDLTPAEARVAAAAAEGRSVAATAASLNVSRVTVKSHRRAIFAKTGARRDRDLRRLVMEASRLDGLAQAAEVVLDDFGAGERLRIVNRPEAARRVALIDYGPASGRILFVLHGYNSWRRVPLPFAARLQKDGWRPVVVQRPGYGLSDPAERYLEAAADDMAAVIAALGGERAAVFARGGSAPSALAFAGRHPDRFARGVLINPLPSRDRAPGGGGLLNGLLRLLLRQPDLIAPVIDQASRRTSSDSIRRMIERLYLDTSDRLPPDRPEILEHLVRDAQGLVARSTRGLIEELKLYAGGWSIPADMAVGPWRVALSPDSWSSAEADACSVLPGYELRQVEGVIALRAYTAPDPLADLLRD